MLRLLFDQKIFGAAAQTLLEPGLDDAMILDASQNIAFSAPSADDSYFDTQIKDTPLPSEFQMEILPGYSVSIIITY